MEQKRAITKGSKLDYFILSSLFFFPPQFITDDDVAENADIDLYIWDQLMLSELWKGVGKVLESIVPKGQLWKTEFFRSSVIVLWSP